LAKNNLRSIISGKFRTSDQSGFTLLEVLIAMAIMIMALSSILAIESGSINASARAKRMNIVAMLAKNQMIQTEYAIQGKAFDELEKEQTGNFEAPYEEYSWKREIKEITFPSINPAAAAAGAETGATSADDQSNSQTVETMAKLITNFLSKSIREVDVSVIWKRSGKEQTFTVGMYWVDLNHAFELSE
jgi:general secretion pathway protein I